MLGVIQMGLQKVLLKLKVRNKVLTQQTHNLKYGSPPVCFCKNPLQTFKERSLQVHNQTGTFSKGSPKVLMLLWENVP